MFWMEATTYLARGLNSSVDDGHATWAPGCAVSPAIAAQVLSAGGKDLAQGGAAIVFALHYPRDSMSCNLFPGASLIR